MKESSQSSTRNLRGGYNQRGQGRDNGQENLVAKENPKSRVQKGKSEKISNQKRVQRKEGELGKLHASYASHA